MKKNVSISIVSANYLSFINQAKGLADGFEKNGYKVELYNTSEIKNKSYLSDIIISVGSWRHWKELYKDLTSKCKLVMPWLVSDDQVLDYIEEINKAPKIFVTSKFCKETFKKYGIRDKVMEIIPEGINTDFWKPISQEEKRDFLKLLGINEKNKPVILLTIGGDGTSKGAMEVISSLKEFSDQNILYLIKIFDKVEGFVSGVKEKKIINKYGLQNKIRHIMGNFSQEFIRKLLNICDIYAAPSRHEGFGLIHIEAMACSKPVITCYGTAADETSIDQKTSFIVNSIPIKWKKSDGYMEIGVKAKINSLKKSVKKLLDSEKLREEMGNNGRQHVLDNYSDKRVALLFIKCIEKMKNLP